MRRTPGDILGAASPRVMALPAVDVPETSIGSRDKLIVAIVDVVIKGDGADIIFIALVAQLARERIVRLLHRELGAIHVITKCGGHLIIFIINCSGVLILLGPSFLGTTGR